MAIKNPASIGQAINLAAADARQINRESDVRYIYKRFVFWTNVCELIQSSDLSEIQTVLDDPKLDELMKQLTEIMK